MKTYNTLVITSSNPDVVGTWHKDDVEQEMAELGLQPESYGSWISYVIDHFDFPASINKALEDDSVCEIKFMFGNDFVRVRKTIH